MTAEPAPRPAGGRLRVDAERNRRRIITAARQTFAELGLEVPMEDIARRAGVGVGTLYRRYPTRGDLIAAAFQDKMRAYAEAARQALADPDPWQGFCGYVEQICAMQAGDRGFTTVLTMTFPTAKQFEADRRKAFTDFTTLVDRAKAAGKLRTDFTPEDMPMFLMANAGVLTATADAAPHTWRPSGSTSMQGAGPQIDPVTPPGVGVAAPVPSLLDGAAQLDDGPVAGHPRLRRVGRALGIAFLLGSAARGSSNRFTRAVRLTRHGSRVVCIL